METDFDPNYLLSQVDGDQQLFDTIVKVYLDTTPEMLLQIRKAVTNKDASSLEKAAHHFKSSVSALGTKKSVGLLEKLEEMGRNNNLTEADIPFAELEKQLSVLNATLLNLKSEG